MDFGGTQLYTFEAWNKTSLVADITQLVTNVSYTITRNDAETLQFDVDLFKFESYCKDHLGGMDPHVVIQPYATDIKVKRNGVYLFGTQVVMPSFNLAGDSGNTASSDASGMSDYPVTIYCTGYLNFFKDRYITKTYTNMERVAIAIDIINTTQAQTNGSFGVTIGSTQFNTGFTDSERTYSLDNIKTKLQELANISDYPFDFGFSYDKVFSTYQHIGAVRDDITFIYGGELSNVQAFSMDRDASQLYNKIYGIGFGFGSAALTNSPGTGIDTTSQLNYYLREEILQNNSVTVQATLDQNTNTELAVRKDLLELPKITVVTPQLNGKWINIGDIITFQVLTHTWLSEINGKYRTEQIQVSLDDNQNETIDYVLDNQGVS